MDSDFRHFHLASLVKVMKRADPLPCGSALSVDRLKFTCISYRRCGRLIQIP